MKVLVTGGNGFVGKHIVNYLTTQGYQVSAPSSQELDLRDILQVQDWFNRNTVDAVVHCALSGREDLPSTDSQYLADGLLMFRNLWRVRDKFNKLINLGTAYELDLNKNNSLVTEDEFLNHLPLTSYGYSKNIIARIIRETENFFNLRLFGVFHETESDSRFFKRVKLLDQVTIFSDIYLDYIYLEDIFPVINSVLLGNCQIKDVNVVYATKYRLSEMAGLLCDYLNFPRSKIIVKHTGNENLTGDSSKMASLNLPAIGLLNGLRKYK